MRILVALDSFKDALGAAAAGRAVVEGLRAANPAVEVDLAPLTDGGEGFVEVLAITRSASVRTTSVPGPLGEPVMANWALVPARSLDSGVLGALQLTAETLAGRPLAVLEMAQAAGLEQVLPAQRNPWLTSTRGFGMLLTTAAGAGAGAILVGLGGSATNDLGLGALAALGLTGTDRTGCDLTPLHPATWHRLAAFNGHPLLPGNPPVRLACDVTHPLLGPLGATATFGPQKGLPADDVGPLDALADRVAHMLIDHVGSSATTLNEPGAGAAGGLGWGLRAGLGARVRLVPGFDLVGAWLELPARVARADLVITGEGRFDATSLGGKGPGRLIQLAHTLRKPIRVLAGSVAEGLTTHLPAHLPAHHITAITHPGESLAQALPLTDQRLRNAARRVMAEIGE